MCPFLAYRAMRIVMELGMVERRLLIISAISQVRREQGNVQGRATSLGKVNSPRVRRMWIPELLIADFS
jgi:hypothetical protein